MTCVGWCGIGCQELIQVHVTHMYEMLSHSFKICSENIPLIYYYIDLYQLHSETHLSSINMVLKQTFVNFFLLRFTSEQSSEKKNTFKTYLPSVNPAAMVTLSCRILHFDDSQGNMQNVVATLLLLAKVFCTSG